MVEVTSATRYTDDAFWTRCALGLSLRRLLPDTRLARHIAFANGSGLPDVFNARIDASDGDDILLFVHDDVWLEDMFLADHLEDALRAFDVVGVAGNRRRVARQPAWAFVSDDFAWDGREHLSGAVSHGVHPFGEVYRFGPSRVDCELLDGVFLAARRSVLRDARVRFDPRFRFHLYDVDFCRSARRAGLKLGTWPIAITHQSEGKFNSPDWRVSYDAYLAKWGE